MNYSCPPLILDDESITDALRRITLDNLPTPQPQNKVRLKPTTPLMERLWLIALADIESNIVDNEGTRYFGAGKRFGLIVYTRDISYSGIFGLNRLYPELMLASLKWTRDVRLSLGLTVSQGCAISEIDGPWQEEPIPEKDYLQKHHTNSYTRRTDDVIWLWAAMDLFEHNPELADWEWLYQAGKQCFDTLYAPFYAPETGLFRGQASFVDIHFVDHKTTGYPQDWTIDDCVLIKSLSTNCLYFQGLKTMATAAGKLGMEVAATNWQKQAEQLRQNIRSAFARSDGTLTYFIDRNGQRQPRREALGSALAVITGICKGNDARKILANYPITDTGAPLFHPFFDEDNYYHNNTSWPFVDTFLLKALEMADGQDRTAQNVALLARTCVDDGSFHEVVDYRTKEPRGSGSQLWSAASFVDTCFRAGLVENR